MNINQENARRLFLAISRIDGVYYLLGKNSGVKENVLVLLYALADGKPKTQKQISEDWMIPKTTINSATKECVGAGYVAFTAAQDGREKLLSLTESGKTYAEKVLKPVMRAETAAMEKAIKLFSDKFIEATEGYAEFMKQEKDKL